MDTLLHKFVTYYFTLEKNRNQAIIEVKMVNKVRTVLQPGPYVCINKY